jgi:hypothetical protein
LVVEIALEHTELSSRELAHKITDEQGVFISRIQCLQDFEAAGFNS